MKKLLLSSFLTVLMGVSTLSEACTGIKLTAKDGKTVHGRTFEFGIKVDTSAIVVPRGYSFTATTPKGKGMTYQAKYATVGTICFDNMLVMDGMNETGLSVGTFYFPGFAAYTPLTQDNETQALSPLDFPNWIVTQFSTIDEVKKSLSNIVVVPTVYKDWGKAPAPFHYVVFDKNGDSIVIEPTDGKLIVYDNPLGITTNSPAFDWHMTNLRNFINLTPKNAPSLMVEGVTLSPFGQGSGMVGLPGDFTPPSRFVRAAIFAVTAMPSATTNEAVFQAFHILNQFDIPVGVSREVSNGIVHSDYTLATVVHDPSNLMYYIRTFDDQTIRSIDLKTFDKQAKEIKKTSTAGRQSYVDISNELKPVTQG